MRPVAFVGLLLLVPLAAADTESGTTPGIDLGNSSTGIWDVFQFNVGAGTTTLSLSWTAPLPPPFFADYNLFLYPDAAFDDNSLEDSERIAMSWHGQGFQPETITAALAGQYWIAVAPWQTQGETYTLTSSAGTLNFAASATGVQSCSPCP